MYPIIRREQFGPATFLWEVGAPDVARAARPGHFIMARIDEHGERIPLTVADFNVAARHRHRSHPGGRQDHPRDDGPRAGRLPARLHRPAGPAQRHPQARRHGRPGGRRTGRGARSSRNFASTSGCGNRTVSIIGFRTRDLVFWEEPFREFSDRLEITTDDGSYGRKGFVTAALAEVLAQEKDACEVVAIGPIPMMRACCEVTRPLAYPDRGQSEFHHGGWHRDVRFLPRHRGRRHEIRLRGWRRFRRPPGEFR